MKHAAFFLLFFSLKIVPSMAQNPLIMDQFSADPSARVFGDRVYIYPSHDILANEERGRPGWFCMEDYHVFSSENLSDWTDHGVIVSQNEVPWVKKDSYSMWAPDCIERDGKYYFYFPSRPADTTLSKGFAIGVAIADQPTGPFEAASLPIAGVHGIDPNVFIDTDGQAYLYWSEGHIYGAKLQDNMKDLASDPVILANLPTEGLKEGPYLFERNGLYYLTYPHVEHKTERLEYAIGHHPLGPFEKTGVIMDESAQCWTNHQSILPYKGQWYLFYHFNDLSPNFDKARSIRADSLFFNEDGTIRQVIPTKRGVGLTDASQRIEVDRYSAVSDTLVKVSFVDTNNTFKGWKLNLRHVGAWSRYNQVDFGHLSLQRISLKSQSNKGAVIEISTAGPENKKLASVTIPAGSQWQDASSRLLYLPAGVHDLVFTLKQGTAAIDWIKFE